MADTPVTLAQWVNYASVPELQRWVISTLIDENPLLGLVPMLPHGGSESFEWSMRTANPTVGFITDTSTMYSSASTYRKCRAYLSSLGGDVEIPIMSNGDTSNPLSMESEEVTGLVASAGIKIASEMFKGNYMTEANVTIVGSGVAAPYVDAVTAVSANMPTGLAHLKYTHTGTFLQFKAPGSQTWGAQVACATDDDYTVYDGDDTTKYVTLTVDVSDLAADTTMMGALTFQRPEEVAGLAEQSLLDTDQVIASTGGTGDAVSLSTLDYLDDICKGPKAEKILVMPQRTRRAVKALIMSAGGTDQAAYQDARIAKAGLHYEGIPIYACPDVAITESKGGVSTLTSIYCLRLNPDVGVSLRYGVHNGPNHGTLDAVSQHSTTGAIKLPVYLRRLGERDNVPTYKWRLTASMAVVLKRAKSCARAKEITS